MVRISELLSAGLAEILLSRANVQLFKWAFNGTSYYAAFFMFFYLYVKAHKFSGVWK